MKQASFQIIVGDALTQLRTLPADSVQTCVTSPPYWGLRDYGVEGQVGLEPTPTEFLDRMVEIFREVRRVLRPDGTAWVNLGDTYASSGWGGGIGENSTVNSKDSMRAARAARLKLKGRTAGAKPKDKVGIPWRTAFALQNDGWWLRSDIVWHKANPMPECVRDRPTVSHEFIFLLTKSERYFYNTEEARERTVAGAAHSRISHAKQAERAFTRRRAAGVEQRQQGYTAEEAVSRLAEGKGRASGRMGRGPGWRQKQNASFNEAVTDVVEFRNWRDVWTIPSQPSSLEHFAAFPEEIPKRCIIAGSRPGDLVLDPFAGTGTTGLCAFRIGRRFVGIELNPTYAQMANQRIRGATGSLFQEASP